MLKFVKFIFFVVKNKVKGPTPKDMIDKNQYDRVMKQKNAVKNKHQYDMVYVTDKKGRKLKFRPT
jgi:hypothetical protein